MLVRNVVEAIRRWQRTNATRRELYRLSDEQLADIGLIRGRIDEVACRMSRAAHRTKG